MASDLILRNELLPFAQTPQSHPLLQALHQNNRTKFPTYWDELLGTADGSGVPFLHVILNLYYICYFLQPVAADASVTQNLVPVQIFLINFRKEILAFIPKGVESSNAEPSDDCSDVLVVDESMAIAAHNEDANVALLGHT